MQFPERCYLALTLFVMMLLAGCASFSHENEANTGQESITSTSDHRALVLDLDEVVTKQQSKANVLITQSSMTVASTDQHQLSLADALQTAGVENPIINLAREAVREAEAQLLGAEALKLPSFDTGIHLRMHTGNLQQTPGTILDVQLQSLYFGAGAGAWGAGTVLIPGLRLSYPLADIIGEPQVASQRVNVRMGDQVTIENVTLLDVVEAYYRLAQTAASIEALHRSQNEFDEVARLTRHFAETGQGRQADYNRAEAYAVLQKKQLLNAEGEATAASARLSRILNLDPTYHLNLSKDALVELKLIDSTLTQVELQDRAENNRPEIVTGMSMVGEAQARLRQEEVRPWLPTITAGFSYGGFSGSGNLTNSQLNNISGRTDFDVTACWTFQNFGLGNQASQHRQRAVVFQAVAGLQDTRNRVRAEVAEAFAQLQAVRKQLEITRRQLVSAEETYLAERKRIEQGEGLPLEVLDSVRSLSDSRLAVIQATVEVNIAQFRLLTAIGTSSEQALCHP
ncbi:MAG: TolC family protein [Gemmatales bacterium]